MLVCHIILMDTVVNSDHTAMSAVVAIALLADVKP